MQNKLFVRNISFRLSEVELEELFTPYGEVISTSIPKDRDTGRSRGFAFVEMKSQSEAEAAIEGLKNREVQGREIFVSFSESKARTGAPAGGGGGGGGGYGGSGGGGGGYGGGGGGGRGRY